MADFHIPELGEGVYEAEFVSWLVKTGQTVKRGQPLMEVLTDKATMEVPSPFAGTITTLNAEPGQKVKVGQTVLAYSSDGKVDVDVVREEKVHRSQPAKGSQMVANRANGNKTVSPAVTVKAAPSVRQMPCKIWMISLARA